MRIKAKVLSTKIDEQGHMLAQIQCNGKLPPKGIFIDIHFGSQRSLMQNAFYFEYLTFLYEDCELKNEYLTIEELHETFKATFLSERIRMKGGLELIKVGSTTTLDKAAFAEYLDKIDKAVTTYLDCDTSSFWETYKREYQI